MLECLPKEDGGYRPSIKVEGKGWLGQAVALAILVRASLNLLNVRFGHHRCGAAVALRCCLSV